jgi:hypothetical protein
MGISHSTPVLPPLTSRLPIPSTLHRRRPTAVGPLLIPALLVQLGQAIRHVFAGVDGLVFGRVGHGAAGADGLDERVPVWLPEPGDGVAGGDDCGPVGGRLVSRGGLDDPVLSAAKCVIEPAGEEIADCVGLRGGPSQRTPRIGRRIPITDI